MTLAEFFGYLASALVFTTFYMKTMVPLRAVAIFSNLAFITYASLEGLVPVLVLHAALLPVNLIRLRQILQLVAQTRSAASGEFSVNALLPYMSERKTHKGEVLFEKGDTSHEMYYIASGTILLQEIGVRVGQGDVIGEISLFAPNKARTATAICESDGVLFSITEDKVLQLYHQNPRFGFHLVKGITQRLLENYSNLEMRLRGGEPSTKSEAPPRANTEHDRFASSRDLSSRKPENSGGRFLASRRAIVGIVLGVLVLVFGAAWNSGSYLTAVFSRDAAVTTWLNTATTPIQGQIGNALPRPGDLIDEKNAVVMVKNSQADDSAFMRLQAQKKEAENRVVQKSEHIARLEGLSRSWRIRTETYAAVFISNLEQEIEGAETELDFLDQRLELVERLSNRIQALADRGTASRSDADEALAEVMDLKSRRAELEKYIAHAHERLEAAHSGIFLSADGINPDWAFDSEDSLRVEIAEARNSLEETQVRLQRLDEELAAARDLYERMSETRIEIPVGSTVWSVPVAPNATVEIGALLLEWIDCRELLIDVPVNDIEIGLLEPGMMVSVLLEGEEEPKSGRVLLMRGRSAKLGDVELAAAASAQKQGSGQVIVRLEDVETAGNQFCPVGRAASVDFIDIGLVDLIRAHLRL